MERIGEGLTRQELEAYRERGLARLRSGPPLPRSNAPAQKIAARTDCPMCGGSGWFRPDAPTQIDGGVIFAAVPCSCKRQERQRLAVQRLQSDLGELAGATWDRLRFGADWTPVQRKSFGDCVRRAKAFATRPTFALVLTGETGNGKSTLLACIGTALAAAGRSPLFAVTPDLLDRLREAFSPKADVGFDQRYQDLREADVLLLDDLGMGNPTPWALEKLEQLVDYRYRADRPLAVSTNLGAEDLALWAPRIYSRLARFLVINRAPDYRQREGA